MRFTGTLAASLVLLSAALALAQPAPNTGSGIIEGIVVNERQEPVPQVRVQAFSVRAIVSQTQAGHPDPFSMRAGGTASTDTEGRFRISALEAEDYLVAAEDGPSFSGAPGRTALYGITFHPSTTDYRTAVPVLATPDAAPIRIELVRVKGARVTGSVTSPSGNRVDGMEVRLFHRFGDFGSGRPVGVVQPDGTFEVQRVPPRWYRLTIARPEGMRSREPAEFANRLIDVPDQNPGRLSLTLGTGASISGRVVPEPGARVPSPVGMRVSASPADGLSSPGGEIFAPVARDWSFRMSGLDDMYQFTVSAQREPFLKATRITVDGDTMPSDGAVSLIEGSHDVVVFVAPREPPPAVVDPTLPLAALIEQFKDENVFFRQFGIGQAIAADRDARVLAPLVPWLTHEDRHIRGNTAFIFGALGQIGDRRAVGPLLDVLDEDNPSMRVLAIYALETLKAKEALPRLTSLLTDHRPSNVGSQMTVADAARAAIAKLR